MSRLRKQATGDGDLTGWVAVLDDGSVVEEAQGGSWNAIKGRVVSLSLLTRGRRIDLPKGQVRYFRRYSGSCGMLGGSPRIEARIVGFETTSGVEVAIRIGEGDGRISVEVGGNRGCRP